MSSLGAVSAERTFLAIRLDGGTRSNYSAQMSRQSSADRSRRLDLLGVMFRRQEAGEFRWRAELELEEPAAGVRFGVHQRGVVHDGAVDFGHLAADRGVDVAGGLDGLHDGAGLACLERATDGRQFDEHDVRQLMLGVVGDAHGGDFASDADPFVRFGVFQIGWNI